MNDDRFINQTEAEKGLQERSAPEKAVRFRRKLSAHSSPIVKKFMEFTRSGYKFSIKDFYFR